MDRAENSRFKVYIAGPMESVGGNMNFPLFNFVARNLRAAGCEVYNPADHYPCSPEELLKKDKAERKRLRRAGMKANFDWICDHANVVLLLPGWERAPGAKAESAVAMAMDITIRECPTVYVFSDDEFVDLVPALE